MGIDLDISLDVSLLISILSETYTRSITIPAVDTVTIFFIELFSCLSSKFTTGFTGTVVFSWKKNVDWKK